MIMENLLEQKVARQQVEWLSKGTAESFIEGVKKACNKYGFLYGCKVPWETLDYDKILDEFTFRDKVIIFARFGVGVKYTEICKVYGFTCVRARQVAMAFVTKMCEYIESVLWRK